MNKSYLYTLLILIIVFSFSIHAQESNNTLPLCACGDDNITHLDQPLPLQTGVSHTLPHFDRKVANIKKYTTSNPTIQTVGMCDTDCASDEADLIIITQTIAHLLNAELMRSGQTFIKSSFDMSIEINESGSISSFELLDTEDPVLEKHIEKIVLGWQIKELNPTHTIHLIIPVQIG